MPERSDNVGTNGHVIRLAASRAVLKATPDWTAVARALGHRLDELGWSQTELAQRSRVSPATIRGLQHANQRRRNARTLQDLSLALGWHPDHLAAVLHSQPPPPPDLATTGQTLQEHLDRITNQLDLLHSRLTQVLDAVELVNNKLSARPTTDAAARLVGEVLPPIPLNKADIRRFAAEHGYTVERAGRVWNTLYHTHKHQTEEDRRLPPLYYLGFAGQPYGDRDERVLDLRGVYERLVASKLARGAWWRATKADLAFLVQLVNHHLKLDEPLVLPGM